MLRNQWSAESDGIRDDQGVAIRDLSILACLLYLELTKMIYVVEDVQDM